jgi:hypothetical protein
VPAVKPDAFAVVLDPLLDVIVEGDAVLKAPPAEPQVEFEFVVDKQKTIVVFVPGYGTEPARVALVPVTDDEPVAVAEIVVPTVILVEALAAP